MVNPGVMFGLRSTVSDWNGTILREEERWASSVEEIYEIILSTTNACLAAGLPVVNFSFALPHPGVKN